MKADDSKLVRDWDRILLRVPDGMRDELESLAAANCRALNGQLIVMLKRGLAAEKTASEPTA